MLNAPDDTPVRPRSEAGSVPGGDAGAAPADTAFQPVRLQRRGEADAEPPRPVGRPARTPTPGAYMPVKEEEAVYQRPDDFDRLMARIEIVQRKHRISDTAMSTMLFAKNSRLGELRNGQCSLSIDTLRRCHQRLDDVEKRALKGQPGWRRMQPKGVRVSDNVTDKQSSGGGSQAVA